jgi:hypothetical protein
MKSLRDSVLSSVGFALGKKMLALAILLATCSIAILVFLAADRTGFRALNFLGGMVLVVGLFGAVFSSREIVTRMEQDNSLTLSEAVSHTLYGYLLYISFIPIIGPFAQRLSERKNRKNPFVSEK